MKSKSIMMIEISDVFFVTVVNLYITDFNGWEWIDLLAVFLRISIALICKCIYLLLTKNDKNKND